MSLARGQPAPKFAVFRAFIGAGILLGTFLPRIPQLRENLGLSNGELGLLLLASSVGSMAVLPLTGVLVGRFGPAKVVAIGAWISLCGLFAAGATNSWLVTALALAVFGVGSSIWDVAMNVAGARVEQDLGPIMPHFHAAFSLASVAGALLSAGVTWAGLGLRWHFGLVALAVGCLMAWRHSALPGRFASHPPAPNGRPAWGERRTLALGLLVLGFSFAEGAANGWLAVAFVDGYGLQPAVGAALFAVFVGAMTLARLAGPAALKTHGRVLMLRWSVGCAAAGVLGVCVGWLPAAAAGAGLWGLGVGLGFPVGMSAAADIPGRAAARVSVVASIGFTSYLAGPPLLGWLAQHVGVLAALLVVLVALALAGLTSGSAAPDVSGDH